MELRTLGHLDLRTADGTEMRSALAQGKRMALLSYLAAAQPRGFHRRDTLVGMFWPETDQHHARAALRQALHFLRQALGPDVVLSRGSEDIGVDFDKLRCDVVLFEDALAGGNAEQAVETYGGPFLNGFFISNAPEFERWLGVERDRLSQLYADALRSLAEDANDRHETNVAARWWKRLGAHAPYSSEVACRLTTALEASGDRAGAITSAQLHIETVRRDLEVEPDESVLNLVQQLRQKPSRKTANPLRASNPAGLGADGDSAATPSDPFKPKLHLRIVSSTVIVFAILAAAVFGLWGGSTSSTSSTVSLAVLPFENLGSQEHDYFVTGLAEDIVSRLAGVRKLSLVGPNNGGLDTPDEVQNLVSAATNAQFMLRGTVDRFVEADGTVSIRVVPGLTRVSDGAQIWTDVVVHELPRVFEGQIHIVEEVVRLLGLTPLSTESEWLRGVPTTVPAAHDLYLLGNDNLRRASGSANSARTAVDLFERATTLDTSFVQAFAKLSIANTSMFWWGYDRSSQRLAEARTAADEAIRLRADMPDSHLALGWYYYWGERDYDLALRHFELARTNWPGVCDVLVLVGGIRRRQGDFYQAISDHQEAASSDPSCATCYTGAAFTHLMLRDFSSAGEDVGKALSLAPDFTYARRVGAMSILSESGDTATARAMLGTQTAAQLIRMSVSHWSAIPRILGGEYDDSVSQATLGPETTDTAAFYAAKAELATRVNQHDVARAYYDSARVTLERMVLNIPDDPMMHAMLGLAYAGSGLRDEALREGTEATRLRPVSEDAVDGPLMVEMLARIYTLLGEADNAINRLEVLLSVPSHVSFESLRLDPVWTPLRQHQRFHHLHQ